MTGFLHRLVSHHDRDGLAGLVIPLDDRPGDPHPFAGVIDGNLLAAGAPTIPARIPGGRLIAWSGTLADTGLFDKDPRTWMPAGLEAFRTMCDAVRPLLDAAGVHLLFRPHARHVLCDPHRCRTIANEWREKGAPFALALDPASMIEGEMIQAAHDHLERAFETLVPSAEVVILANIETPPPSENPQTESGAGAVRLVPLHRGAVDPGVIAELWHQHVPRTTPTVLLGEEIDEQCRVLHPRR